MMTGVVCETVLGLKYTMDKKIAPVERTRFVNAYFDPEMDYNDIDCVVGLHTCGSLADAVLRYSERKKIPCLVCPCCFAKCELLDVESGGSPDDDLSPPKQATAVVKSMSVRCAGGGLFPPSKNGSSILTKWQQELSRDIVKGLVGGGSGEEVCGAEEVLPAARVIKLLLNLATSTAWTRCRTMSLNLAVSKRAMYVINCARVRTYGALTGDFGRRPKIVAFAGLGRSPNQVLRI